MGSQRMAAVHMGSEPDYISELVEIIQSNDTNQSKKTKLGDYHEKDIAAALDHMSREERKQLYLLLGRRRVADVFTYVDHIGAFLGELDLVVAAEIVQEMDADDAVDVLENLDEDHRKQLIALMNKESKDDIKLICSYDEEEIGSKMTTNFIQIRRRLTVKQAMRSLIDQAKENDNISTIYVENDNGTFYGAMDLKDLIIAREYVSLDTLISCSYPYVRAHEPVTDCLERLKDYAEDSIPVLDDHDKLLGVITSQDIVEVVDDEMGEDYAKLAGLTAEEDLNEPLLKSMKKRLPWLILLLFLGIGVSSVVGLFEQVVSKLTLIICFQSLILDMAGNVGTQSLAVTIRVLMDENVKGKQKLHLVLKEMRVGFCNGGLLGLLSFLCLGIYICTVKGKTIGYALTISGCVGIALLAAMIISSLVGTVVPMFFHKIKIDPAVASGPLITTVNDLVAVVTYYGLSWI
ncbi:MAG: magnesium transporter, partial [bacterium]|nr:magnesium transporter [bacterium]